MGLYTGRHDLIWNLSLYRRIAWSSGRKVERSTTNGAAADELAGCRSRHLCALGRLKRTKTSAFLSFVLGWWCERRDSTTIVMRALAKARLMPRPTPHDPPVIKATSAFTCLINAVVSGNAFATAVCSVSLLPQKDPSLARQVHLYTVHSSIMGIERVPSAGVPKRMITEGAVHGTPRMRPPCRYPFTPQRERCTSPTRLRTPLR